MLVEAIEFAQNALKEANLTYEKGFEAVCKEKVEVELIQFTIEESVINYVRDNFSNEIREAIKKLAKSERATQLKDVAKVISKNEYCTNNELSYFNYLD